MSKVHVKTGDTVIVISGKDKGKKGQVMAVSPKEGKVIVEKVNMVSKHVKKDGRSRRHHQGRRRYVCFQGPDLLPPLQEGHKSCPQDL